MAGVFTTVYKKDFRPYPDHERVGLFVPLDIFALSEKDSRYLNTKRDRKLWDENSEDLIKALYKDRLRTVYIVDFCKEESEAAAQLDDVMLTYFGELYKMPKTKKLLPPLGTSRRVTGYSRPADYYTPLTEYQGTYCKDGYDIFKKDFDRGVVRMGKR